MLAVKQIFQDTTFGECNWTLILMDLILLEVEFKNRYFNKVLREISVHKPGSQLIAFRLFYGLAQFVVNLIERGELSLVDHREVSPELNQLSSCFDRTLSIRGSQSKPSCLLWFYCKIKQQL